MWLATRGRTRHRAVVTGRRSGDVCRSSSSSLVGGVVGRDVTSAKSSCVKIKSDVTDIDDSALLGQPFAGDVNDGDDASSAAAAEEAETPEVKAQREKARRHANNARER